MQGVVLSTPPFFTKGASEECSLVRVAVPGHSRALAWVSIKAMSARPASSKGPEGSTEGQGPVRAPFDVPNACCSWVEACPGSSLCGRPLALSQTCWVTLDEPVPLPGPPIAVAVLKERRGDPSSEPQLLGTPAWQFRTWPPAQHIVGNAFSLEERVSELVVWFVADQSSGPSNVGDRILGLSNTRGSQCVEGQVTGSRSHN